MTALMSDDIIDSSTGKYVLYGSYGDLNKFRKLEGITGVQLHHLNQQGVFGETIPYRDGVCIMLRGNAITEKGSEHNLLHIWTEVFLITTEQAVNTKENFQQSASITLKTQNQ